jgi:hypothetical protein
MFWRLRNNICVESLCMEAYSQFNNGIKFRWFGEATVRGCEHIGVGVMKNESQA